MKIIVPLVIVGMLSAGIRPALAGVIWDNGAPASISGNCDSSPDVCFGNAGNPGWSIFDGFVTSQTWVISGITYDSKFATGSSSDYVSSNWSIWSADPEIAFGGGPLFSGNAVASLATDNSGSVVGVKFTLTGLNVELAPGTYWIGYESVLQNDGAKTVPILSGSAIAPGYEQISDDGDFAFPEAGNTVFTIEGDPAPAPGATPEPSAWALAAAALACVAFRHPWRRASQPAAGR